MRQILELRFGSRLWEPAPLVEEAWPAPIRGQAAPLPGELTPLVTAASQSVPTTEGTKTLSICLPGQVGFHGMDI